MPQDKKKDKIEAVTNIDLIQSMLDDNQIIETAEKNKDGINLEKLKMDFENFKDDPVWLKIIQDLKRTASELQENYFDNEEFIIDTEKRKTEYLTISTLREVIKSIIYRVDGTINDLNARINRNVST